MTSNKDIDVYNGLQSAIDLYHQNRLGEAISLLLKLTRQNPLSAKAWGYLGFLYRETDDLPQAVRCYRKTIALSPKSERASLGLFFALCRMRKFADALKEMARFTMAGKPQVYLTLLGGSPTESHSMPRRARVA